MKTQFLPQHNAFRQQISAEYRASSKVHFNRDQLAVGNEQAKQGRLALSNDDDDDDDALEQWDIMVIASPDQSGQ
ncbi:hypothetical protein T01_3546 [Trichinella spiralis]|uniref:Uncharacterized protein n=1 Tax=Trichinella spiralis TaxID=6334 RepID=A0A0V1BFY9_TRISP|nr:hypothetical protein T01_3546 [Trichinella spiralis]